VLPLSPYALHPFLRPSRPTDSRCPLSRCVGSLHISAWYSLGRSHTATREYQVLATSVNILTDT
jgi:hypothetical protein